MPGIDKILRGMFKYHATMKNDVLKQLKMVKDNPQVSLKARSFTSVVKALLSRSCIAIRYFGKGSV